MYDLARFALSDMISFGAAVRELAGRADSMEETGDLIVRLLYERLANRRTGERNCALVRLYKTHPFGALPDDLREFARRTAACDLHDDVQCLTLLATAGDEPDWNDVRRSVSHRTIPLPSVDLVERSPMVAQLIHQLGLDLTDVVSPAPEIIVDRAEQTFNVFFVEHAEGSPYVPAQHEFVVAHGVRSVLGIGGMLPDGGLFAMILFSKVAIARETAELFKTIALNIKLALLPNASSVFAERSPEAV